MPSQFMIQNRCGEKELILKNFAVRARVPVFVMLRHILKDTYCAFELLFQVG
jgi:hypothetical protein